MFEDLTAILLAAGVSSRLWPLTDKLNLSFFGEPLIQYPINQLKKIGIKNIVVVANSENFNSFQKLPNYNPDLNIKIIEQKIKKGMAGGIISALELINTKEVLIVGPSDIVEDYLYSEFAENYKKKPDGIFTGKYLENYEPLGFYSVSGNNISNIEEKPGIEKQKSKIAAIVFDYYKDKISLQKALVNTKSDNDDIYEKAKYKLIAEGLTIKLLSYNGYWGYLKYPWHVLSLSSFFLSKIKSGIKKATIDESAKITGEVLIEDGVTILENVKIVGPAFIGKGTLIGQNSLIRESIIGQNSIVGFNSEITRSYIGNNCWFHHNYIGDSVILDNTSFGFGAVVANYRLDGQPIKSQIRGQKVDTNRTKLGVVIGKNVRIGVNSSFMPGVKIGNNSFVGSSVLLAQDLPDKKYIEQIKNNTRILDNKTKDAGRKIEENRAKMKY